MTKEQIAKSAYREGYLVGYLHGLRSYQDKLPTEETLEKAWKESASKKMCTT